MTHRKPPPVWRRTLGWSLLAGTAGLTLGLGGGTLALWNAALHIDTPLTTGTSTFSAGLVDALQPADDDGTVTVILPPAHAATLHTQRAVAIGLTTASVSQGNPGLRYRISLPDWGDHLFGAADITLFQVNSPAECTVDAAGAVHPATSSTPVPATHRAGTEAVIEHWCLTAVIPVLPDEGEYTSSVTVTARDPAGVTVEATDTWHTTVTTAMDPAAEPDHHITFTAETFR